MGIIFQILLYLLIGFIEMFIVTARTSLISKGKTIAASSVVFLESIVGLFILNQIVSNLGGNWSILIAYSMGGSLGTFVNLRRSS